MNGSVIPGTGIAVDFWQVHKHPGIQFFFLTHLHGDHIVGLTSSWRHPIYCSPLTAQLLSQRYGLDRSVLRPLEVGQSHIVYNNERRCLKFSFENVKSKLPTQMLGTDSEQKMSELGTELKNSNSKAQPARQVSETDTLKSGSLDLNLMSNESKRKIQEMGVDVDNDEEMVDCQSEMLSPSLHCLAEQQRSERDNVDELQEERRGDNMDENTKNRIDVKCHYVRFSPSQLSRSNEPQRSVGDNPCAAQLNRKAVETVSTDCSVKSTVKENQECHGEIKTVQPMAKKMQENHSETLTVTVIDANHCPGAIMFLFEGSFGKILYTGDFRYCLEMVNEDSVLFCHIGSIDRVYLDNTYCSPNCVFPTREEALEEILQIAHGHSDCDILLGLRGLGKEELVAAVALALEEWVCVPPKMLSLATTLGLPNVFKTAQPDLRIRVVPFHSVSGKFMREVNKKKRTIAILPTALYQGIDGEPFINQPDVFVVPYSDHSSYPELIAFVSKLKPRSVVPIVRGKVRGPFGLDISERENMSCFKPFLSVSAPSQRLVHSGGQSDCSCTATYSDNTVESRGHLPQSTTASSRGLSEITSAPSFDSLFPDFVQWTSGPAVKRAKFKHRSKQLQKRSSIPKGVEYLPDEEDWEVNDGLQTKTERKQADELSETNTERELLQDGEKVTEIGDAHTYGPHKYNLIQSSEVSGHSWSREVRSSDLDRHGNCETDKTCEKMSNKTAQRNSNHDDDMGHSPSLLRNCENVQMFFLNSCSEHTNNTDKSEDNPADSSTADADVIVIQDSEEFLTQTDSEIFMVSEEFQTKPGSEIKGETTRHATSKGTSFDSAIPQSDGTESKECQSRQTKIGSKYLSAHRSPHVEMVLTGCLPGSAAQMHSRPRQTTCDNSVSSTSFSESHPLGKGHSGVSESRDSVSHVRNFTLKENDLASVAPLSPIPPSTQLSGGQSGTKRVNVSQLRNDYAILFGSLHSNSVPHPRAVAERRRRLARTLNDVLGVGEQNAKQQS